MSFPQKFIKFYRILGSTFIKNLNIKVKIKIYYNFQIFNLIFSSIKFLSIDLKKINNEIIFDFFLTKLFE